MALKFSVGIPAYNEEGNIGNLLRNLLEQPLAESLKMERIVVEASGSTDRTPEIVRGYANRHSEVELITEETRRGKSSSFNTILNRVDEELLIYMSADNLPAKGSLNELLLPFLKGDRIGGVTGRPLPINNPDTFWGYISHLIWRLHHEMCLRQRVKLSGEFCAVRCGVVNEIPHRTINDDVYLEWLIRKRHYDIVYAPKAISLMRGPNNLRDFINQRRRVAGGHLQIHHEVTGRQYMSPTYDFVKVFPVIPHAINPSPKGLFWSLTASILEAYSHILARYDKIRGRMHYTWKIAPSTKKVKPS